MAHIELIAEVGSVHDGSIGNAAQLVETAAECGVDAVKFQTHLADAESVADAPSPPYFTGEDRTSYFRRLEFTSAEWQRLRETAHRSGIRFLSSPFSIEAVTLLEEIEVDGYKIASGEVTNRPMIEAIAATGKPTYLSSGMSSWAELDEAVATLESRVPLAVLQCSSMYPCPPERVGLNVISEMRSRYGLPVGLSDHTMSSAAAIAAAALGATVIEKHLTFSRKMYGSDAVHSMEPDEFAELASALREVEKMLDHSIDKDDLAPYQDMKTIFEKSIVAASELEEGTALSLEHLAFKKPGDGIPASRYRDLLGRRVKRRLERDEQIAPKDLA